MTIYVWAGLSFMVEKGQRKNILTIPDSLGIKGISWQGFSPLFVFFLRIQLDRSTQGQTSNGRTKPGPTH
jgi:hypothetical protein